MLTINVIVEGDAKRINGTINGQPYNIAYSDEMMDQLNVFKDEYETLETGDEYYAWVEKVEAVIKAADEIDQTEELSEYLKRDNKTGRFYLIADGKAGKAPLPARLAERIQESLDKGISPDPIAKAWVRFANRNPHFNAHKADYFARYITARIVDNDRVDRLIEEEGYTWDAAIEASIYNDVAITQEGLLVTKKYARLLTEGWKIDEETNEAVKVGLYPVKKTVDQFSGEVTEEVQMPEYAEELTFEPPVMGRSGDAFYCGDTKDHIIKVGEVHKLESWDRVDTNDNSCCVRGLHVGGMKYVQSYKSLNCQLLECFVDPADIGAIMIDAQSDGAIRVKEYFIYGAGELRNKGLYHSSKYAAKKDAEWQEELKAAIEKTNAMATELEALA